MRFANGSALLLRQSRVCGDFGSSVLPVLRFIKSIIGRKFDEFVVRPFFTFLKNKLVFFESENLVRWPSLSYRVVSDVRVLARANGEESNKCPIEERFIQVLAALILLLQVDRERKILAPNPDKYYLS